VDTGILLKDVLGLSALILSVINGLMLLRQYARDRAILKVHPVHPEVYQWWFRLPDGEFNGTPTRKYGFLLYVDIVNRGLRRAGLQSWTLSIKVRAHRRTQELMPLSIPKPVQEFDSFTKVFPVLGQAGPSHEAQTVVESGCSVSGWAYYAAEYYGDEEWNPVIEDEKIEGTFVVCDVLGGATKTQVTFSRVELLTVEDLISGIATIPSGSRGQHSQDSRK
jgi:hypothetical protein